MQTRSVAGNSAGWGATGLGKRAAPQGWGILWEPLSGQPVMGLLVHICCVTWLKTRWQTMRRARSVQATVPVSTADSAWRPLRMLGAHAWPLRGTSGPEAQRTTGWLSSGTQGLGCVPPGRGGSQLSGVWEGKYEEDTGKKKLLMGSKCVTKLAPRGVWTPEGHGEERGHRMEMRSWNWGSPFRRNVIHWDLQIDSDKCGG